MLFQLRAIGPLRRERSSLTGSGACKSFDQPRAVKVARKEVELPLGDKGKERWMNRASH
jgi:hypothetical protein